MSCIYVILYIDFTQLTLEATSTNVTIIPSLSVLINVSLAVSIACHLSLRSDTSLESDMPPVNKLFALFVIKL